MLADKTSRSGYSFKVSYQQVDSLYEALLERHRASAGSFLVLMPRLEKVLVIDKGISSAWNSERGQANGFSRAAVDGSRHAPLCSSPASAKFSMEVGRCRGRERRRAAQPSTSSGDRSRLGAHGP